MGNPSFAGLNATDNAQIKIKSKKPLAIFSVFATSRGQVIVNAPIRGVADAVTAISHSHVQLLSKPKFPFRVGGTLSGTDSGLITTRNMTSAQGALFLSGARHEEETANTRFLEATEAGQSQGE